MLGYTSAVALPDVVTVLVTFSLSNSAIREARVPRLSSVGGDFRVANKHGLTTLDVGALETVGGYVSISNNRLLATYDTFSSLRSAGSISVTATTLTTLDWLNPDRNGSLVTLGANLTMWGNQTLPLCEEMALRDALVARGWSGVASLDGCSTGICTCS